MSTSEPSTLPPYLAAPSPAPVRAGRVVALGVGLAAALVGGSFAIVSFATPSGAPTPEAAVERLFEAVEQTDPIGILESLVPAERRPLQDGLEELSGELTRIGILDDGFSLGPVEGLEVDVEGLELSVEDLGGGIAAVRIDAGTITSTIDPSALPIGSAMRDLLEDDSVQVDTFTAELGGEDLALLVAVDTGDGWHVSVGYTVAEIARRDGELPLPPFGHGVEADGDGSPDGAVRAMVEAGLALDVRRVVGLTPPGEMAALHDYAPLFLDDVEEATAEAAVDLRLDRFETDVEVEGDVAHVRVTDLAVSGTIDGDDVSVEFDGDCLRFSTGDEDEELCADDDNTWFLQPTLTAVREDGEWFVSPSRTFFDLEIATLRQLEKEDVEQFGGLFGLFFLGAAGEGSFEAFPEESDLSVGFGLAPAEVAVGDCLLTLGGPLVPCDGPHDYEAFADAELRDDPYVDESDLLEEAYPLCQGDLFQEFAGAPYDESPLFVDVLVPTEDVFEAGDRRVVCLAGGA